MSKTRTLTVPLIGLLTVGLGLFWSFDQHKARAVSPTDGPPGQEGAEVDARSESSLINPLTVEGVDDGIFPKAAEAALDGPGGTMPSLAWVGDASTGVEVTINGFPVDSLGRLQF